MSIARLAATLLMLVGLLGPPAAYGQDRETFTFTPPERSQPERPPENRILRDVHWTLKARGRWNLDLESRGKVRVTEGLVRVEMPLDDGDPPLRFSVFAGEDEISHIAFTQTGDTPSTTAMLYSSGANFLERAGRETMSLGAGRAYGYLANHDGFVRVDRRDNGLIINYSLTAVHCADITEPPFTSVPPCAGRYFINSRPDGRSRIDGCIMAFENWRATPDACLTPFQIDRVSPEEDRENVAFDDPGLSVTFSEPVKLDTLGPAFTLHTLAPDGEELRISGEWTRDGASRYRFLPEERLYSGTIYRAQIDGGPDGVESQTGGWLEEPYEWSFSTQLDLAAQAPPDDLPVRLHNFQVVRDGELTAGKPTLTRAYFNWVRHEEVAEDMQPKSFRFRFETSVEYPRWLGQHGALPIERALRIWRHDDVREFDETDRRMALHTANFFGWRPAGRQGFNTLQFHLEPHDPFPSAAPALRYTAHKTYSIWDHDPAPMVLHYSFAQVGAWRDGVPAAARTQARQAMQATVRDVPAFFPHRQARAVLQASLPPVTQGTIPALLYDENGDPVAPEPAPDGGDVGLGSRIVREAIDRIASQPEIACALQAELFPPPPTRESVQINLLGGYMDTAFAEWYHLHRQAEVLDTLVQPGDVVVLFIPEDFFGGSTAGLAYGMSVYTAGYPNFGFPHMRVYVSVLSESGMNLDTLAQIHLHELGHEFGLVHVPGDARMDGPCPDRGSVSAEDLIGRNMDGIEAWRMMPGGLHGWNKSQEEGNAQVPGTLVSMMWPWALPRTFMSLTDTEYTRMQASIRMGPAVMWQQGSALPPAGLAPRRYAQLADSRTDAATHQDQLVISGRIGETGTGLEIISITRRVEDRPPPAAGRYTGELRNAAGEVLARSPLGLLMPSTTAPRPPDDPLGWARFRLSLPILPEATELLILDDDGNPRARLSSAVGETRIEEARIEQLGPDSLHLRWQVAGPHDQTEISFSPNGAAPWRILASDARGELVLHADQLDHGRAPTLRINARNGLRFSARTLSLPEDWSIGQAVIDPTPAEGLAGGAPLSIQFNTQMDWAELQQTLSARDADGQRLELVVVPDAVNRMASILLRDAASARAPVELEMPEAFRDLFGRRVETVTPLCAPPCR